MKLHLIRLLGAFALVVSFGASAQGLSEALIDVVPFGGELNLDQNVINVGPDADPEGVDNSRFGRATAFSAKEGGEAFGQAVSEAASANAGQPGFTIPNPPAGGGN